jgi:hypothetical protein
LVAAAVYDRLVPGHLRHRQQPRPTPPSRWIGGWLYSRRFFAVDCIQGLGGKVDTLSTQRKTAPDCSGAVGEVQSFSN